MFRTDVIHYLECYRETFACECAVGVDDSIGLGEKVWIPVVMSMSNAIKNKINLE